MSRPQVCDLLGSAISAEQAVVVPLRPGRKHLLPTAQWGKVTVDDLALTWTSQDAHRLGVVQQLRAWGFTGAALASPTPPFAGLRKQPRHRWAEVLDLWTQLDPWRETKPYFDLAVTITASLTASSTTSRRESA